MYIRRRRSILVLGISTVAVAAGLFVFRSQLQSLLHFSSAQQAVYHPLESEIAIPVEPPDMVVSVPIVEGSTFGILMEEAGVGATQVQEIVTASAKVYDLSTIRVGRSIDLTYDATTQELVKLLYQINTEEELVITRQQTMLTSDIAEENTTPTLSQFEWVAARTPIEYEVTVVHYVGTIEQSLYQTALDMNIDERAIVSMANVFQWTLDFAMDIRSGDEFALVYEQRYRDGQYIMPGQIIAGKVVNRGDEYYAYYFEESADNQGFFDQNGHSLQTMFLKAPVEFRYISSGFTTAPRYVEAFNQYTSSHRAIDYVAAAGTPIRAVGDGTVAVAGWNGPYGNFISIRHNGTYTTNYAHLSKYAVRAGQKVVQGQTIGYVGSTGYSTGPHLHYEMVKNGEKINPLREILPPGEPIAAENMSEFDEVVQTYASLLNSVE